MSGIGTWRQRARWAARIALVSLLAACGGGGGGDGGDGGDDIAVGLTTAGSATTVQAGGTLVIRANVVNTTSNMDVTWSLTGPNCPANCGTIASTGIDFATYTAPASVSASFQVMVTATSIENPAKSGSVQLTVNPKVCPANSSLLSGAYAIHLQGFDRDTSKGMAAIGTITADACGSITDGMVDSGSVVPITTAAVTGSYSIGADRHGTLTLTVSGVSKTLAISLGHVSNGVAQRGGLLETAPTGVDNSMLVGTLWAQDKSAFAQDQLAGNYAYLLNGWTADAGARRNERLAIGGTVTLDNSGNFSSGLQDRATYNAAQVIGSAWSASTPTFSTATGRAVLTSSAFDALGSTVVYVVSPAQQLVLITNANGAVLSGQMVKQSGAFTQASLSGTLVTNQTQSHYGSGYESMNRSILAVFTADGVGPTGTLTSTMNDDSSGCNVSRDGSAQYGYEVAANGQVSVYLGSGAGRVLAGKHYLTRNNAGFLLGFDPSVPIGEIRPRSSGPFSVSSISGNYFATQLPGSTFSATNSIGIGSSAGNATLATTMDTNAGGGIVSRSDYIGGALNDLGNGRFTDAFGNVIYAVAPTVFLVTSISATDCYPVVHLFEQ